MNTDKRDRTIFVGAVILLVYTFIRVLMPVDEVPSSTLNALHIAQELGMFIGVVGMAPRILRSLPEGAPRGGWIFLLVVGVIAGIGIFGIRLAGGPRVELAPRTSSTADTGPRHQVHEQIVEVEKLSKKLAASRWLQTFVTQDPVKARTLTRQDLQEERTLCRDIRECADRILKVFADATAKGVAHSTLSDEPGATRPETWQATREVYSLTYDYLGLIEQHWDEWLANPFPAETSDLKPWQVELQQRINAAAAAAREAAALLRSTSSSLAASDDVALPHQLREAIQSWQKANDKVAATRWATLKKDPNMAGTRTRQDLQEGRAAVSEVQKACERIVKILTEAKSKGIDVSKAWPLDQTMTRPELWTAAQQMNAAILQKFALIDEHWAEWKAQLKTPDEKSMKPWEREMKRLDDVIAAKLKEAQSVNIAATATPSAAPSRAPSPPASTMSQLILKTRLLSAVADYNRALGRLQATRWVKSPDANSYHPQKITRADLHDANEKLRELIAAIDKLRTDLDAQTVPVPASEKEYWRIKRETSIAFQQLTRILEENWKEWHVTGIQPKTGEVKPWQKEALRLQGEIDKLKQIDQTSILL